MNKKEPKQRNHVVKKMIERGQGSGYHKDKAKETEKYLCREDIDYDLLDDEEMEDEGDL